MNPDDIPTPVHNLVRRIAAAVVLVGGSEEASKTPPAVLDWLLYLQNNGILLAVDDGALGYYLSRTYEDRTL